MIERRFSELLALNPNAVGLHQDLSLRLLSADARDVEAVCLELLTQNLGLACIFFFHVFRSTRAVARSIVMNDLFTVSVICVDILREQLIREELAPSERARCVDTVAELLISVGDNGDRPRRAVKPQLVAAYLLCAALEDMRRGRGLLTGVTEKLLIEDEIYSFLGGSATIAQMVGKARSRLLT